MFRLLRLRRLRFPPTSAAAPTTTTTLPATSPNYLAADYDDCSLPRHRRRVPVVAPVGCEPKTDAGNCYQAGEFCRDSDHGASGTTATGEAITCADNDGWRWEPA